MFKNSIVGVLVAASLGIGSTAFAGAPALSIQSEQKAHPKIMKAVKELDAVVKHLNEEKDDFGGNKAGAIEDSKKAIHSLKKAMYFRLKMDDAAIDAAQ